MTKKDVDVIIATSAKKEREESLLCALDSIVSQPGVTAKPIVVINGVHYDNYLKNNLEKRLDLLVIYEKFGSAPNAHKIGRLHSKSEYFCFLDDDDLFLADTMAKRVYYLDEHPELSLLVCNGYRNAEGHNQIIFKNLESFSSDPLGSLLKENWMASCAGLFRASDIKIDYFNNYADYMEWTVLGFRIAQSLKVGFLDIPAYQINFTPGSLSQSKNYLLGCISAIEKMLNDCESNETKTLLDKKYAKALHDSAGYFLIHNELSTGLKYHMKSLRTRYGSRYILFSRKFIYALAKRAIK